MSNTRGRRGKKRRREHAEDNGSIELPNGKKHRKLCDNRQSAADRRALRVGYRELQEITTQDRPDIVDVSTSKFAQHCERQDTLFQNVSYPSEAFLDIQHSKIMAGFLVEQTQELANAQFTFNASDIVQAVKSKFRAPDGGIDWARIGERAAPFFRSIPQVRMMNGKMQRDIQDVPVKAKRQYKRKVEKNDEPATQPSVVKAKDIKSQDKTETKTRIQRLKKTLRTRDQDPEKRVVNMFELLVNPKSYSETVENFFDMSFLCRQGFSQLEVDDATKQPIITYVSGEENKMRRKQEEAVSNSQCIVKLDPYMFRRVVDTYDISESQIEREMSLSGEPASDDPELDRMLFGEGSSAQLPPRRREPRRTVYETAGSQKRRVARGKRQMDSDSDSE